MGVQKHVKDAEGHHCDYNVYIADCCSHKEKTYICISRLEIDRSKFRISKKGQVDKVDREVAQHGK